MISQPQRDPARQWRESQIVPRDTLSNQRCLVCGVRVPVKPIGRPKERCKDHELASEKFANRRKALRSYYRHHKRNKAKARQRAAERRAANKLAASAAWKVDTL